MSASVVDLEEILTAGGTDEAAIIAEMARLKLRDFVQQAWSVVEGKRPLVWGWHLDAVCDHLEAVTMGHIQDLIINIPPRCSKSTTVSVMWPAWEWINSPHLRWMFTSYAASLVLRDSVKCRDVILSPWYQKHWGPGSGWEHAYTIRDDQNSATRYVNDKTGYRMATTCEGVGTGHGGDRIVVDDPHNTKKVENENDRESRILWWQRVMSTRKDTSASSRVIIMQRSHERDLTGYLLAEEGGFELLRLPARYESDHQCHTSIGFRDPRTADGELLAPDRFDEAEVSRLEHALGSYASAAQLQQRPSPRQGGIFKAEKWQYYKNPPEEFDFVIQSWDMAFKALDTSSYVCGQVWGFKGADNYLLHQERDRMDFVRTCEAVVRVTNLFPEAKRKYVEDKANGPAIISALRKDVSGLIEFSPNEYGSKEARASAISPQQESCNVYLPEYAPWVKAFVEEASLFPNSTHKDQVDTMSQALLAAEKLRVRQRKLPTITSLTKQSLWKGAVDAGGL